MFKSKSYLYLAIIVLLNLLSSHGVAGDNEYTPEMIKNCKKLTEDIDTSDWVIDMDLDVLEESALNMLDDGWNKKINEAKEQLSRICEADKNSDECLLAKEPIRQLIKERRKCYYRRLMKSI